VENFVAKILAFSIIGLIGTIGFGGFVEAQDNIQIPNPLRYNTVQEIIYAVVNYLFWLALSLVILFVLIGAFYILTSGGNRERLSTGKKFIIYAAIGFILTLGARGVIGLILGALGVR
jgi:hypothetical protein